jgi:hypothetical protein
MNLETIAAWRSDSSSGSSRATQRFGGVCRVIGRLDGAGDHLKQLTYAEALAWLKRRGGTCGAMTSWAAPKSSRGSVMSKAVA